MSLALVVTSVITVISASPASAHVELVRVAPGANAQLSAAPAEVALEFNAPVSPSFATVAVTTSAGVSVTRGKPIMRGAKVTQAVSLDLAVGDYRIAYRVVGEDGHPVTGESRFSLAVTSPTGSSTSAPSLSAVPLSAPRSAAASSAADAPQADVNGASNFFLISVAGAVGLLVTGAVVLLWRRQRR